MPTQWWEIICMERSRNHAMMEDCWIVVRYRVTR